MRLAVVGSRTFNDYGLLTDTIYKLTGGGDLCIVSGGAKGADNLAEKCADEFGFSIIIHLPEWDKYGKSAGYIRNKLIVEDADAILAFWDGESKGTKHTIDLALEKKKDLYVIFFNKLGA